MSSKEIDIQIGSSGERADLRIGLFSSSKKRKVLKKKKKRKVWIRSPGYSEHKFLLCFCHFF